MISPDQIRAGRALINAKQSELAKAAGVSLATLNNIERGLGDPRASTLASIEDALASAGVFVEQDNISETVILKKYDRPNAYDSFTASQRVMEVLRNNPLIKIDSVLFYMRRSSTDPNRPPRVCILVNGKTRQILFDQVGFTLENSARIAEVSGVMLAALLTAPKAVYFHNQILEDTTLSTLEDAVSSLNKASSILLRNPKDFMQLSGDWEAIFAPLLLVKGHPLKGLLDYSISKEK